MLFVSLFMRTVGGSAAAAAIVAVVDTLANKQTNDVNVQER